MISLSSQKNAESARLTCEMLIKLKFAKIHRKSRKNYFEACFTISNLFNNFIAKTFFVSLCLTNCTSPKAPRPITLITLKWLAFNRAPLISWTDFWSKKCFSRQKSKVFRKFFEVFFTFRKEIINISYFFQGRKIAIGRQSGQGVLKTKTDNLSPKKIYIQKWKNFSVTNKPSMFMFDFESNNLAANFSSGFSVVAIVSQLLLLLLLILLLFTTLPELEFFRSFIIIAEK